MDEESSTDSKDGIISPTSGDGDSPSTVGGKSGDEEGRSSKTHLPTWSGSLWQDGNRKSAFQPYRQQTTVLTNLQRGNIQTLTPVLEPLDVSMHHRAGQGELSEEDFQEEVDVDEADAFGLTPLHWACYYGQLPTVQLLLQKGATIDKEGKEGETALHLAAANGHHDTLKVLLSKGADIDHVDEGNCWDPHSVTQKEFSLSHNMVKSYAIFSVLTKNLHQRVEKQNSNTALMYAAFGDHPHCVNELLVRGADFTLKNINNDSVLGIAIDRSSSQAQAVIENHLLSLLSHTK